MLYEGNFKDKETELQMTWIQFGLLAVLNFMSVLGAVALLRWVDIRRKQKFVDGFLNQMEEKISTEIKFGDLVKRFEEDEERK
jgi:uncharacterized membrane protein